MADNVDMLLAAIAHLEEKLSAKIDSKIDNNFKQMKQLTEEGLKGLKEEMTEKMEGVKEEMVETMEGVKEKMVETMEGVKEKIDEMGERMVFLEEKVEEVGHQMEENMYKMEERIMEKLVVDKMEIVEEEEDSAASEDEGERSSESNSPMASDNDRDSGQDDEEEVDIWAPKKKRAPRKKSNKIQLKTGVFTADEMLDFLNQFEKGFHRTLLAYDMLIHMKIGLKLQEQYWDDEEKQGEMWEYDRHRQPAEFVDLKADTFLTDPSKMNLCLLQTHILDRICGMLVPLDFVELSLACRYLNWRMFTFCTCHAPYTVQMKFRDDELGDGQGFRCGVIPKSVYFTKQYSSFGDDGSWRGLFVVRPPCLKKPFHFAHLEIAIESLDFKKEIYEKCLAYILDAKKFTKKLHLEFNNLCCDIQEGPMFALPYTNDFLEAIQANSCTTSSWKGDAYLWANCNYLRKMEYVYLPNLAIFNELDPRKYPPAQIIPWSEFNNRIGFYGNCPDEMVMKSVEKFFRGDPDIEFHLYHFYKEKPDALLEYFFKNYAFEETYVDSYPCHRWHVTVDTDQPERRIKMAIYHGRDDIAIGWEKTFKKWETYYLHEHYWRDGLLRVDNDEDEWNEETWEMATAVETEDDDGEAEEDQEMTDDDDVDI